MLPQRPFCVGAQGLDGLEFFFRISRRFERLTGVKLEVLVLGLKVEDEEFRIYDKGSG